MTHFDLENISKPFVMIGDTMFGDFDMDDFNGDDFDGEEFDASMGRLMDFEKPTHWTTKDGKRIKYEDMSKSHILNSMNMMRRNDEAYASQPKYLKLQEELATRNKNVIIVKREFRITRGMLIKLMRSKGIILPLGGCGFYVNESAIDEIVARWDTDEPIKVNQPKAKHANKNRNRGTVSKAVPRRRSTKRG